MRIGTPHRKDAKDTKVTQVQSRFCVRIFSFAFIASLWCGLVISSPIVSAATVDLPTYVQRLTLARDAISQAKNQAGTQREASLRRANDALSGVGGVAVDGVTYDPQLGDALSTLNRPAPDLDRALALVTTLRDTAEATRAATPDADARRKLDTVLQDRDFRRDEPNFIQQNLIDLRTWLGEQIRRLTEPLRRVRTPDAPNLPERVPGVNGFAAFLAALGSPLGIAILVLLIALVIAVFAWRSRRKKPRVDTAEVPERTATQWRDYAAALAVRGDHRAAVRAIFLGTLRDLDERNVVPFDASRTDREYLRAVTERAEWLAEPMRPFVRLVEGIFYGGVSASEREYTGAREHAEAVRAAVAEAQAFAAVGATA